MAQIDLGKLKFTWKGNWITNTAYEVDDVVYFEGTSYLVILDLTTAQNTAPSADSTSYAQMASGLNYRGTYSVGQGFKKGDIVQYNNATYIYKGTVLNYVITGGSNPSACLLYTSPSPRDTTASRMPSSA